MKWSFLGLAACSLMLVSACKKSGEDPEAIVVNAEPAVAPEIWIPDADTAEEIIEKVEPLPVVEDNSEEYVEEEEYVEPEPDEPEPAKEVEKSKPKAPQVSDYNPADELEALPTEPDQVFED